MTRRLLMALALFTLCLFVASPTVSAFDPFNNVCGSGSSDSAVCQTSTPANNPVANEMINIANIVAWVGGAAAVIIIIISALKFVTSGSDISTGSRTDTDVEDARRSLAGALIGLIIIVLARTLIVFVLNRIKGS